MSEENSDDSEEEDGGANAGESIKRRKASRRRKKRTKLEGAEEEEPAASASTAQADATIDVDALWNDFKNECEDPILRTRKSTTEASAEDKTAVAGTSKKPPSAPEPPKTKTVTELFEFAGEAVEVQKEVPVDAPTPVVPAAVVKRSAPATKGGLSSVLGQLGKKNKLSVLEKSKLDWDSFKKEEGIAEELQTHNKGKDGYLEKQDFLQRADLRQFELEKAMRNSKRLK